MSGEVVSFAEIKAAQSADDKARLLELIDEVRQRIEDGETDGVALAESRAGGSIGTVFLVCNQSKIVLAAAVSDLHHRYYSEAFE